MPGSPRHPALKWTAMTCCLLAGALALSHVLDLPPPPRFTRPALPATSGTADNEAPFFAAGNVTSGASPEVHCATAVSLPDNRIRSFWFGGSREGASDVSIWSSVFDPASSSWSKEQEIITRAWTGTLLHRSLRKIGNPVVHRDTRDRLWLFFVTVSVGGWSGSAINLTQSTDDGETWSAPRRLITTPFLNFATLVRQPVITYEDGSIGLPVHQEFIGNFCEIIRLNPDGDIIGKFRLTHRRRHIQPLVFPESDTNAFALMRDFLGGTHHVGMTESKDGGRSWSPPVDLDLPNPNSALGGVQLADGRFLLAFNRSQSLRSNLSLAISNGSARDWRSVARFDQESGMDLPFERYGYPWLLRDDLGVIHLFFTADRKAIRHLRFNAAWLDEQLKEGTTP